jgi:hypothetical protein
VHHLKIMGVPAAHIFVRCGKRGCRIRSETAAIAALRSGFMVRPSGFENHDAREPRNLAVAPEKRAPGTAKGGVVAALQNL